ncbi:MAG TPA: GNAT family N-acetyltransferase [Actinomycetales bacterium]|nr:GNAT family N-acetyltransferase [Actinomycetales bacterium]
MSIHVAAWRDLDPLTLHDIVRLRVDVFVVEQACPYPELDGRDVEPGTEHVWWADSGELRVDAYLRVLAEPGGGRRIGRVVTRPEARRRGLSTLLVRDAVQRHGHEEIVLDAQSYLVCYYATFGFAPTGPEFIEDGVPHVPMRRAAVAPPETHGQGGVDQGSAATSSPSSTRGPV